MGIKQIQKGIKEVSPSARLKFRNEANGGRALVAPPRSESNEFGTWPPWVVAASRNRFDPHSLQIDSPRECSALHAPHFQGSFSTRADSAWITSLAREILGVTTASHRQYRPCLHPGDSYWKISTGSATSPARAIAQFFGVLNWSQSRLLDKSATSARKSTAESLPPICDDSYRYSNA